MKKRGLRDSFIWRLKSCTSVASNRQKFPGMGYRMRIIQCDIGHLRNYYGRLLSLATETREAATMIAK